MYSTFCENILYFFLSVVLGNAWKTFAWRCANLPNWSWTFAVTFKKHFKNVVLYIILIWFYKESSPYKITNVFKTFIKTLFIKKEKLKMGASNFDHRLPHPPILIPWFWLITWTKHFYPCIIVRHLSVIVVLWNEFRKILARF